MSNSERALLTSKYQLIENIKSLNLLFPQAIISFVIANTSITSSLILGEVYEPFRAPIFFQLYCVNVIVMSLYWTFQSTRFTFKLSTLRKSFLNQITDAPEIISLKATFVKTALGQRVKAQQTIDEHFLDLKNLWE
uniref:Uncharacterized protein n=1 Tax=Panagrolaimus superbus TaxID=310955 RepID=A0A914Z4T6_9BILA